MRNINVEFESGDTIYLTSFTRLCNKHNLISQRLGKEDQNERLSKIKEAFLNGKGAKVASVNYDEELLYVRYGAVGGRYVELMFDELQFFTKKRADQVDSNPRYQADFKFGLNDIIYLSDVDGFKDYQGDFPSFDMPTEEVRRVDSLKSAAWTPLLIDRVDHNENEVVVRVQGRDGRLWIKAEELQFFSLYLHDATEKEFQGASLRAKTITPPVGDESYGNPSIYITQDQAEKYGLKWGVLGSGAGDASVKSPKDLTLRDQFAMAALTGFLSNPSIDGLTPEEVAHDSYGIADAMMKARGE